MIDINLVRQDPENYKKICTARNKPIDVDLLLQLDDQRKDLQNQIDKSKFQQKELAAQQKYDEAKALKTTIQ